MRTQRISPLSTTVSILSIDNITVHSYTVHRPRYQNLGTSKYLSTGRVDLPVLNLNFSTAWERTTKFSRPDTWKYICFFK
eukprot:SAG31_NODE_26152_length_447_cov_1.324713_1_plen_79_part_10